MLVQTSGIFLILHIHGDWLDEVIGVVWTTHVLQVLNEDVRGPQLDKRHLQWFSEISGQVVTVSA